MPAELTCKADPKCPSLAQDSHAGALLAGRHVPPSVLPSDAFCSATRSPAGPMTIFLLLELLALKLLYIQSNS